jgi:HK97 gp10 family phage protein
MTTVVKIVRNDVGKLAAGLRNRARAAARKAALDTKREITDRMSDAKSGRIYKRGQKIHQASAPGEAPAIDTGLLVNSIQVTDYGRLGTMVYTNTEYAEVLELGGRHILPRPYMRPAVEKIAPKFLEATRQLIEKG